MRTRLDVKTVRESIEALRAKGVRVGYSKERVIGLRKLKEVVGGRTEIVRAYAILALSELRESGIPKREIRKVRGMVAPTRHERIPKHPEDSQNFHVGTGTTAPIEMRIEILINGTRVGTNNLFRSGGDAYAELAAVEAREPGRQQGTRRPLPTLRETPLPEAGTREGEAAAVTQLQSPIEPEMTDLSDRTDRAGLLDAYAAGATQVLRSVPPLSPSGGHQRSKSRDTSPE